MHRRTHPKSTEKRHIFLVGFSGSGKSTVGPLLARRLNRPFFDSDAEIVKRSGRSVAEFFAEFGESSFRKIEQEVIRSVVKKRTLAVVSLGGGALLTVASRKAVFRSGYVVYLRCSMREIEHRLSAKADRPLLHQEGESLRQRIQVLLPVRKSGYEMADLTVTTTTRTPAQTVGQILEKLGEARWL